MTEAEPFDATGDGGITETMNDLVLKLGALAPPLSSTVRVIVEGP